MSVRNPNTATPRSFLLNPNTSSQDKLDDLQSLLSFMDTFTLETPWKSKKGMDDLLLSPLMDRTNQEAPTSVRDPTPSKPKHSSKIPPTPAIKSVPAMTPQPQKKGAQGLNDSTIEKEFIQSKVSPDPPVSSHAWLRSPQRARPQSLRFASSARDPEPTFVPGGGALDESIVLGTGHAEYDLASPRRLQTPNARNASHVTTHFDQTSFEDRQLDDSEEHDERPMLEGPLFPDVASTHTWESQERVFPRTPHTTGYVIDAERPPTPQDAKEWLQTAMATLQEAQAERDSARKWAQDMKDAVQKWTTEQRRLIQYEANHAFDSHRRQPAHATPDLSNLESMLHRLHQEFQSTQSSQRASEERLQNLLLEQHQKIKSLSQQLQDMQQQQQQLVPTRSQQHTTPLSNNISKPAVPQTASSSSSASSRIRKLLPNGKGRLVCYSNGVQKELHADGTTVIRFTNGDIETHLPDGTVAYFHANEQVLQVTAGGPNPSYSLFEYPNGQIERHYPDGSKVILFPDGTQARISKDGKVETYMRV
eukprot:Nitzschia sp. Nitz4//scaffold206_size41850//3379//4980//NITZ4_007416-RA/size41850-processed-gene-0.32-mRNA-1//-1//CDS//3329541547//8489//frame0